MEFVLVTGNAGKLRETERILGRSVESVALDLPEIQSLDLSAIAAMKARAAFDRLQRAVVVEDTGLALRAMNGFPGPLVKWMLRAIGPEGIARAADGMGDLGASAVCALAYDDGRRRVGAVGETTGRLVVEPRGDGGFGWDPVFVPDGAGGLTYAEIGDADKDRIGHRGRAWRAFERAVREELGDR